MKSRTHLDTTLNTQVFQTKKKAAIVNLKQAQTLSDTLTSFNTPLGEATHHIQAYGFHMMASKGALSEGIAQTPILYANAAFAKLLKGRSPQKSSPPEKKRRSTRPLNPAKGISIDPNHPLPHIAAVL